MEENEIVFSNTAFIPVRLRRVCQISSAMIIRLNAQLTSRFINAKECFLALSFVTPNTLKLDLASKKVKGKSLIEAS